jgi:hypothetical protein
MGVGVGVDLFVCVCVWVDGWDWCTDYLGAVGRSVWVVYKVVEVRLKHHASSHRVRPNHLTSHKHFSALSPLLSSPLFASLFFFSPLFFSFRSDDAQRRFSSAEIKIKEMKAREGAEKFDALYKRVRTTRHLLNFELRDCREGICVFLRNLSSFFCLF